MSEEQMKISGTEADKTRARRAPTKQDHELRIVKRVMEALNSLEPAAQERVCMWVQSALMENRAQALQKMNPTLNSASEIPHPISRSMPV